MSHRPAIIAPSRFIAEWVERLRPRGTAPARALDVAMGRGRHAHLLARAGFRTFGVDIAFDAVREAVAAERGRVIGWCADLTQHPLPPGRFDLIVVTRYLQRDLFDSIAGALTSGGVVLYETFTTAQRAHGVGPTSPAHLLDPGELRDRLAMLELLFYEEVIEPDAVARIVARRSD